MPSARRLLAMLLALVVVLSISPAYAAKKSAAPPKVTITSAQSAVTRGGDVAVTFTSNAAGRYQVLYRAATPVAATTFTVFPDAGANGRTAKDGPTSVGVTAPVASGTYDLKVIVKAAGDTGEAVQANGLVVTTPPATEADRCDNLDSAHCMLPFPNDRFTAADPTTDTGRRVNFSALSTPRNVAGKPIDPTEWNRNDGFSPGAMVMTMVPGLDLHQTWATADLAFDQAGDDSDPTYFDHRDHIADIDRYQRADAPMVLLNTETGERHPFWSELDMNVRGPGRSAAGDVAPSKVLILRPATNLQEGVRYVVAMRNLKDAQGATIDAPAAFKGYRAGTTTGARALKMEQIFRDLDEAGVGRDDLYLAWDFTVASERNLSERMLTIRDDAFRQLGDTNLGDGIVQGASPKFVIDSSVAKNDNEIGAFREIKGRVTVPNYLDRNQEQHETRGLALPQQPPLNVVAPGSKLFDPDGDGRPQQNPAEPTLEATFTCRLPLNMGKVYPGLYGHGLLGQQNQVGDFDTPGMYGFAGCAADWIGMSTEDISNVAAILADMSNFGSLPDRAQQGFLNFLYIGRAMTHPQGFASHAAWQSEGQSLLHTATDTDTPLFYDGNSQGGIMGGALVAVSPDIKRGILGVTGMNYSTLLNRSVDWEGVYGDVFYTTYPDKLDQQIGFAMIQMLWDRGEANGYALHMTTDPLRNTPAHEVQLQVAWSDHQVTNHAAEVEARTIGAPVMVPGLDSDADHWGVTPYAGIETASYPYKGSHLVYWDSGNRTPPNGNIPAKQGRDPHGDGRKEAAAGWQEAHFLLTGEAVDVCAGRSYLTNDHPLAGGKAYCTPPAYAPGS